MTPTSMQIAIRADASTSIGMGHIVRCMALAEQLRAGGAQIVFVCQSGPGSAGGWLADAGYRVLELPAAGGAIDWHADAEGTRCALAGLELDWLIVDHYQLDARWENSLRRTGARIMVIDDLADRPHWCDLLLDQNLYQDGAVRYDARVPTHCKRLLGPRYALLRPQFLLARQRQRARDGKVGRVLLAFGGSDPGNETAKALQAISLLERRDLLVDVVVGRANPHRLELEQLCSAMPGVAFHCQVDDMAQLMLEADLCIGAGGSTTWERCCLGVASLIVAVADNQVEAARTLADQGYLQYLGLAERVGAQDIAHATAQLVADPGRLQAMAQRGMQLVDGNGAARVAAELVSVMAPCSGQGECA
jgi:UDP-2,4-diacetamido-2,4,6-trideoxy-beta-L-altropyranose hydrolase